MSRRGRSSSSTSRCPQETDLRLQGGERGLQEAARLHQPSLLFYPLRRGFSQSAMRGQSSLLATGPAIRPTCPASNTRDARGLLALAEAGQVGCIDPMVGSQPLEGGDHVAAGDDQPVHQYHRGHPSGGRSPEARACTLSPPTGVQIPSIYTERWISGAPVGSPSRRTGRNPPGRDRSGACRSRRTRPLRTGGSTPGMARGRGRRGAYRRPSPR